MAVEVIRVDKSGFEIMWDPTAKPGVDVRNSYEHCLKTLADAQKDYGREGLSNETITNLRKELEARRSAYLTNPKP